MISLVQVPIIFHVKKLEKMEGIDFFYVKLGQQVKSAIEKLQFAHPHIFHILNLGVPKFFKENFVIAKVS